MLKIALLCVVTLIVGVFSVMSSFMEKGEYIDVNIEIKDMQ